MSEMISKPPDPGTVLTPITTNSARASARVEFFSSPIDLRELRGRLQGFQALHGDPLILCLPDQSHCVVMNFGAVILWNCTGEFRETLLNTIRGLPRMSEPVAEASDSLSILLGQAEDGVSFKEIHLQRLTLEHLRIISQAMGRSAALKHCELSVGRALESATSVVDDLKQHGKLPRSGKNILRMVGFTLDIRETILSRLTLFDEPPETWTSERLARLHNLLYDNLDIRSRAGALQSKLDFLADLNETLMNLLHHLESHRLELIVAVLVVVEVVIALIEFFARPT